MDNDLPAEAPAPAPETSAPALSPAGFWVRGGALVLDSLILALGMLLPHFILGIMANLAYKTIFISRGGQTPGKMAAGIKVVAVHGGPVGAGRALGRAAGEYVSAITLGLGYLSAAFADKRALHDYIAGTRVVYLDGVSSARKVAFSILGVVGSILFVVGIIAYGMSTGTGSAGKFKPLSVKTGEDDTRNNLGELRSALAIYYGESGAQYPATLDGLVPKHIPAIPEAKLEKHPATKAWTAYGAEACTGVDQFGGKIDVSKLKDTGGWGYVADPKAACAGEVFVDCTHQDARAKAWISY